MQPLDGDLGVDGKGEHSEYLPAVRTDGCGTAEYGVAIGVGYQLDDTIVYGLVQPPARRRRYEGVTAPNRYPLSGRPFSSEPGDCQ